MGRDLKERGQGRKQGGKEGGQEGREGSHIMLRYLNVHCAASDYSVIVFIRELFTV